MGVFESVDNDLQEALAGSNTVVEAQEGRIYSFY